MISQRYRVSNKAGRFAALARQVKTCGLLWPTLELLRNASFSTAESRCHGRFATSSSYLALLNSGFARAATVLFSSALDRLDRSRFRMKGNNAKTMIPKIGCHIQRITAMMSEPVAMANAVAFNVMISDSRMCIAVARAAVASRVLEKIRCSAGRSPVNGRVVSMRCKVSFGNIGMALAASQKSRNSISFLNHASKS